MSRRAIILAGGKGTRLSPYTLTLPKPLVPLGDRPILERIIIQLKENDFSHVTITLNHMAEIIKAFFGDGSKWGLKIDYTLEHKPLSTMGPLTLVQDLPEDFLVMNGDILTDLNFRDFFAMHLSSGALFTVGAHRRSEKIDYGLLHQNEQADLIQFEEKPNYDFLVSMGIYMVNRVVLDYIPQDTFFGFDHLMYKLIEISRFPKIFEYKGYWLDIGRPADYEIANKMVENVNLY